MNFDAAEGALSAFVCNPGKVNVLPGVRFFAADTSKSASGVAEFAPDSSGVLKMIRSASVPLAPCEFDLSAVFRELLGCLRLDFALVPVGVKYIVIMCDNIATVKILERSSPIKLMALMVRAFFMRCLRRGIIAFPLWVRRTFDPIVSVDTLSRFVDKHDFHVRPEIFWCANRAAVRLWKLGFQVDRAASWVNVMPIDLRKRLPFNSRSFSPHVSGVDMLKQDWRGLVNWCNPPFSLIGRVLRLIRTQGARAALVLPASSSSWWSADVCMGSPGVLHVMPFRSRMLRSDGSGPLALRRFRIVFFDFSASASVIDRDVPPAEALPPQLLPPLTLRPSRIQHTLLPLAYRGVVVKALFQSQEGGPSLGLQ